MFDSDPCPYCNHSTADCKADSEESAKRKIQKFNKMLIDQQLGGLAKWAGISSECVTDAMNGDEDALTEVGERLETILTVSSRSAVAAYQERLLENPIHKTATDIICTLGFGDPLPGMLHRRKQREAAEKAKETETKTTE